MDLDSGRKQSFNGECVWQPARRFKVQSASKEKTFLGIVIGAAIGLLVASSLVASWLGPAWIWWLLFPPILPAIVLYLTWRCAILAQRWHFPAWSYLKSAVLAMVLWPCCVLGPVWLTTVYNTHHLTDTFDANVPLPSGSTLVDERLVPLSFDAGTPNHMVRTFRLKSGKQQVLDFYQGKLEEAGWLRGPTGYVEHAMFGTSNWFAHRKICFAIGIYVPSSERADEFSIRLEPTTCDWM